MSQIDELKAINRKLDEIDDRRIADNTKKFYEDLNERFPTPDFTRKPSPRTELYAGQFKNPYTGDILTHNEAENRFVIMLIASTIFLIFTYFSDFNVGVVIFTIILLIFTLFEFYFFSTAPREQKEVERLKREEEERFFRDRAERFRRG